MKTANYLTMAKTIAKQSKSKIAQIGCIIVKDNIIIPGYNHMPPEFGSECETRRDIDNCGGWLDPEQIEKQWPYEDKNGSRYKLVTNPEMIPAEMDAISKFLKLGINPVGSVMYLTHSPSLECAKLIYQCGISKVYFQKYHHGKESIDFLNKVGIQCQYQK